ncbi:MAG TPA: cupin domain-containing protein [Kofleriaceae bacterium]|nr:cupin domain-containing protein [Kofleriaceae bacterium]
MRAALAAALFGVVLSACSQPAPPATKPAGSGTGSGLSMVPDDAGPATQEETLAAIQKAMNELDEGSQTCWAVAATDRFDIEGDLVMRIDVGPTKATAAVVTDNVHNTKLTACMSELLGAYRWAPPLYGQTIQLPFKFRHPDGQSVIDRRLVEAHGQTNIAVSVLLDEANTGNGAASMFEINLAEGASTDWRKADRAELWYFLTDAIVANSPKQMHVYSPVKAGDMVYVAAGKSRKFSGRVGGTRAVLVVAPGGREGTARAGALPTPAAPAGGTPEILYATGAKTWGPAKIYLDSAELTDAPFAGSILAMPAGAKVAEHVHEKETEMLYLLEGSGAMTIAGQRVEVTETSVIQIPPNTKHSFEASTAVRAVQVYTPGGPEQRFKKKP